MNLHSSIITDSHPTSASRTRSPFSAGLLAFLAIVQRDLLVNLRQFVSFLIQVLLQPLFLLFIFGRILPSIGATQNSYAAIFLPGVVALTIFLTGVQGVALPLTLDLGYAREIDDRLLAPLPVSLVALEKIFIGMLRSLIAGTIIFPLAYWILGADYQVRGDMLLILIGLMLLVSLVSTTLGMLLGTAVSPEQIGLAFSVVFTPLLFTGCLYFPWTSLTTMRWFQIVTLFNPLTYATEGLRYAMTPPIHGYLLPTLAPIWFLSGLLLSSVVFLALSLRAFHRRVIS